MPPGRPHVERASYTHIEFRQETHRSCMEIKCLVEAKSDNNLAHYLLTYFAKASKRSAHALVPYARPRGYPSLPNVMKKYEFPFTNYTIYYYACSM